VGQIGTIAENDRVDRGPAMNAFRNTATITRIVTAAAVLAAAATMIADVSSTSKKSTYEKKIDDIMDGYVKTVRVAEASYDKKIAPVRKSCRAKRDSAVAKAGQTLLDRLDRAARDAKRLKMASDAALAKETAAEFKERLDRVKSAHPVRPEVKKKEAPKEKVELLPSHVTYRRHRYLAVMGKYTLKQATMICHRLGGHLAYIDSLGELGFLQQSLPVNHTLWVGAVDNTARGNWIWLNGKRIDMRVWARGYPKPLPTTYTKRPRSYGRQNIHGALTPSGLISRDEKDTCRGFICEWDR